MSDDKEQEIRWQFLEEAREYLDTMESVVLGMSENSIPNNSIDEILRAAHSIKGGAAMMGFENLSRIAHGLEDFFKVIRTGISIDSHTEQLLLFSIDRLRYIANCNREQETVTNEWIQDQVDPLLEQLKERIGEPILEDEANLISEDTEEDMAALIFSTEVETTLQKLENLLENTEPLELYEAMTVAAEELAGLSEMLEMSAFSSLCKSIIYELEENKDLTEKITKVAIKEWRRCQALVKVGQIEALPTKLVLESELELELELELETQSLEINHNEIKVSNYLENSENIQLLTGAEDLQTVINEENQSLETDKTHFEEIKFNTNHNQNLEVLKFDHYQINNKDNKNHKKSKASSKKHSSEQEEARIRVNLKHLEELGDLFGELTIEKNGIQLQIKRVRSLVNLLKNKVQLLEKSNFSLRNQYGRIKNQSITSNKYLNNHSLSIIDNKDQDYKHNLYYNNNRIATITNTLDPLELDDYTEEDCLSREIIDTIVQIQEITTDLELSLEDSEKITREVNRTSKLMESHITKMRMRPISDLLRRFPRALRDMSFQYGKQVELSIRGGSTLIERTILEALNDPLLHLLRNAFDHGIEDNLVRKNRGKPEQGKIEITAGYRGNQTIITVKDDGGGIPLDKVRARGLEMGFTSSDLENISDANLLNLIFEPGFSTAEKVTDLSGRGVGMDVVRTNLKSIRGEIHVDTQAGVGTTFTINVPFTLSVVRVLLVESQGKILAFPNNAIEEMLVLQSEKIIYSAGKELLNWDGFMLPLVRLNQWLTYQDFEVTSESEIIPVINQPTVLIIAKGENLVGIVVNSYWGEQEVTIRNVEGNIKMPLGFTGCTILGDGRVVPLLDALALLRWIDSQTGKSSYTNLDSKNLISEAKPEIPIDSPKGKKDKTIMVVDDSINVRRFLALTLEKHGYKVEQAKDGQDALEKLKTGLEVQAVICDIEMPHLDGFGFLGYVRSEPTWKKLPVIMLTSRSGPKHRQIAFDLGATDYFSKPFKEQELLPTLEKLRLKN